MKHSTIHLHGIVEFPGAISPEQSVAAVRPSVIAHRYSHAIFSFVKDFGMDRLRKYHAILFDLSQSVDDSLELARLLNSPLFCAEDKKTILRRMLDEITSKNLLSQADGRGLYDFCYLLVDNGRIGLLHEVAVGFTHLLHAEEGIERGELTTAIELDQDRRNAIRSQLEETLKNKLELSFNVEPEILGGVRLRIGDHLFDASLRTQLNILKDTIKRGG
jgi:F-type H+-transporting ATPase subunit delta